MSTHTIGKTGGWLALAAGLAFALAAVPSDRALASNDIAKRENLHCTACHDKPGSKMLTDRGKYWELMGGLEGFDEIKADFGACTQCHVRKPGSRKLTRYGRRLSLLLRDMQELKEFVLERHPKPQDTPPPAPPGNEGATGALEPLVMHPRWG